MIKPFAAAGVVFLYLVNPSYAATSEIVQISVGSDVTQTVSYGGPTPNYKDPNPYLTEFNQQYPFWQQYQDTMFGVADVWDQSQIPTTLTASDSDYYNVVSTGHLDGTWTFDASVLAQDLTSYTSSNGTALGTSALLSNFTLATPSSPTDHAVSANSTVIVGNDVVLQDGAPAQDVIVISAEFPGGNTRNDAGVIKVTDGIQLFLVGDSNWFDNAAAAGTAPDLSKVVGTYIGSNTLAYANETEMAADNVLYQEEEFADLRGATLHLASYGAGDGSSEASPLLPTTAGDATGGAPSYSFDVSVAGTDFVYIDPAIAVGYTYELSGSGEITAIRAPSLSTVADADGYLITLPDGQTIHLDPGAEITLQTPVTSFVLSGIDPALMLDPANQTAFVLGLKFAGTDSTSHILQTATQMSPVPLPAGLPLMAAGLAGLAGLAGVSRRRNRREGTRAV